MSLLFLAVCLWWGVWKCNRRDRWDLVTKVADLDRALWWHKCGSIQAWVDIAALFYTLLMLGAIP